MDVAARKTKANLGSQKNTTLFFHANKCCSILVLLFLYSLSDRSCLKMRGSNVIDSPPSELFVTITTVEPLRYPHFISLQTIFLLTPYHLKPQQNATSRAKTFLHCQLACPARRKPPRQGVKVWQRAKPARRTQPPMQGIPTARLQLLLRHRRTRAAAFMSPSPLPRLFRLERK